MRFQHILKYLTPSISRAFGVCRRAILRDTVPLQIDFTEGEGGGGGEEMEDAKIGKDVSADPTDFQVTQVARGERGKGREK